MKRLLILAVLTAFTATHALADDDYSLYIVSGSSAAPTSYAVSDIQKITFSNGNVVVTKTDGTSASVAMSSISSMYLDVTSVDAIETMDADEALNLSAVYDLQGRMVARRFADFKDNSSFASGIYVITHGGQSYKFIK